MPPQLLAAADCPCCFSSGCTPSIAVFCLPGASPGSARTHATTFRCEPQAAPAAPLLLLAAGQCAGCPQRPALSTLHAALQPRLAATARRCGHLTNDAALARPPLVSLLPQARQLASQPNCNAGAAAGAGAGPAERGSGAAGGKCVAGSARIYRPLWPRLLRRPPLLGALLECLCRGCCHAARAAAARPGQVLCSDAGYHMRAPTKL